MTGRALAQPPPAPPLDAAARGRGRATRAGARARGAAPMGASARLTEWLTSAAVGGVVHPAVDLCAEGEGLAGGRGVRATADIEEGALLVAVPARSCVRADACETLASERIVSFLGTQSLSGFVALALALMHEAALGDKSAAFEYLLSMPAHVDSPIVWNDAERALLSATSVCHDLAGGKGAERALFERNVLPVVRAAGEELFPETKCGVDAFLRAAALVASRAFNAQDHRQGTSADDASAPSSAPYLIPGIDMLNHSVHASQRCTRLAYSADGVATIREPAFLLCADRRVRKGEELFNTYGDALSDAQLLATYGFVPEDDPQLGPNPARAAAVARADFVNAVIAYTSIEEAEPATKRARIDGPLSDGSGGGGSSSGAGANDGVRATCEGRVKRLEEAGRAPPVFVFYPPDVGAGGGSGGGDGADGKPGGRRGGTAQPAAGAATVGGFASDELVTFIQALLLPEEAWEEYAEEPNAFAQLSAAAFLDGSVAEVTMRAVAGRVGAMKELASMDSPPSGVGESVFESARRLCASEMALLKDVCKAIFKWKTVAVRA
eukprot:PRCOL_00004023-RA